MIMTLERVGEGAGSRDRGPHLPPRSTALGPASSRTRATTLVAGKLRANVAVAPGELAYQLRHDLTVPQLAAAVRDLAERGVTTLGDDGRIRLRKEWMA